LFETGLIKPFWGNKHALLTYRDAQFNNPKDLELWKSLGYSERDSVGGIYDMKNIMPDWAEPFFTLFGGTNVGVNFLKMSTGDLLPRHSDSYKTYINVHNITDPTTIYRAIVFLEDWKSGHILEVDDTPFTKWSAGDYIIWQYDTPHLAANIGLEPRYTAQVTFTKNV
jgi:hypothetical protein